MKTIRFDHQQTLVISKILASKILTWGGLCLLVAYVVTRMVNPYLFEQANWLDISLSTEYLSDLQELSSWDGDDSWFPPALQWIQRSPYTYPLIMQTVFGIGVFQSVFLFVATIRVIIWSWKKKSKRTIVFIFSVWTLCIYIYLSFRFAKALRYFYLLYPVYAIFIGLGTGIVIDTFSRKRGVQLRISLLFLCLSLVWTAMYMSIHIQENTRITASTWIYENLSDGTVVVNEHWDDPLPLRIPEAHGKRIEGEMLQVFIPDSYEKWLHMEAELNKAEYYFVTSNRAWGSISRLPEKFPLTSQYYKLLLENPEAMNLQLVAEFSSYPSLEYLGIPISVEDDWADETFTVYDHPKVMIFQRTGTVVFPFITQEFVELGLDN